MKSVSLLIINCGCPNVLKIIFIQRNIGFNLRDNTHCTEEQTQVEKELKLAKLNYKDKVETLLSTGNSWPEGVSKKGMQLKQCPISLAEDGPANDLNIFIITLNTPDFSKKLSVQGNSLAQQSELHVDLDEILMTFCGGMTERKSPGSDYITC